MSDIAQSFIQVYTGNGKGKTSAAMGAALRAACHGLPVCFIQFLKGRHDQSSVSCIPNITYLCFGKNHETAGWYSPLQAGQTSPEEIVSGWLQAEKCIHSGTYRLVVLDEINVALNFGYLTVQQVQKTLINRPQSVEIICTGRGAPQELLDMADIATEMIEIHHMYQQGIPARPGFDF
jgi:cob(I)alamin adenosyltransferase